MQARDCDFKDKGSAVKEQDRSSCGSHLAEARWSGRDPSLRAEGRWLGHCRVR